MKKLLAITAAAVLLALPCTAAADDAPCFVLRELDGRIALFSESEPEPLAVYKTPLDSLFEGDIELLREGIRLKNRAEVTRLIADLGIDG